MNWIRQTLFLVAPSLALAGPIYTLTDLGTLGGNSMLAAGVNASGFTVGYGTNFAGNVLAFSSNGPLGNSASVTQSQASAVNNAGQIAGTQYIGNQTYATVWTNGVASMVGGAGSFASAINDSGEVAGMLVNNGGANAFVAENGTVIDLGTFAGGSWSAAYGLNASGQVAGYGMTAAGNFRGFIWTPGQGYTVLGTLGGWSSYAMSINAEGLATGNAQTANGYSHAFITDGAGMQDLGTLGGVASYGYAINDLGVVVGASWTAGNLTEDGFIYENGVMWDMNSLLEGAPGWQIVGLYGINDSNQVVGVGILDGVEHAVLLTDPPAPSDSDAASATPEPATWIAICAGLAGIFLMKRLRRAA